MFCVTGRHWGGLMYTEWNPAKRELAEETGYGGGEWRELMQISPNPGAMTNMTHSFVATGVEKVSEQHLDEHECLTVHLLDRDEVFRHMNDGSMVQSLMLAPLWRYFSEQNWSCPGMKIK